MNRWGAARSAEGATDDCAGDPDRFQREQSARARKFYDFDPHCRAAEDYEAACNRLMELLKDESAHELAKAG
jgi:hypothetical protein